jgi:hypothetical protein
MDWYYPADSYDTIYAVSDLHGDVDVLLLLFTVTLGVVREEPAGAWQWVAPGRVCVVICGDVVDRSRGQNEGGPPTGKTPTSGNCPTTSTCCAC